MLQHICDSVGDASEGQVSRHTVKWLSGMSLSHGVCVWADFLEKQGTLELWCTSAESSCSPPVPVCVWLLGPVSLAAQRQGPNWRGAVEPASSAFLAFPLPGLELGHLPRTLQSCFPSGVTGRQQLFVGHRGAGGLEL